MQGEADDTQKRMLQLLIDLVQIPSVNGEHTERAVIDRAMDEAKALGLHAQIIAKDVKKHPSHSFVVKVNDLLLSLSWWPQENRPNLVVSYPAPTEIDSSGRFLFVAHADTGLCPFSLSK